MISVKRASMFHQYLYSKSFRVEMACFVCSAALGRISLVDGLAPFGTAFLAASVIAGIRPHLTLMGALIGACFHVPVHFASVVADILWYLIYLLYRRFVSSLSRMDALIVLFITQTVVLFAFYTGTVSDVLHGMIGVCLCVLSAFFMQKALWVIQTITHRHVLTDGEQISICILFGVALLAVSDITYMGFSLSVILLLVFSMIAVLARGVGGVAVAVAIGSVLTVGGDFTLMFVGSLAACALAGAMMRKAEAFGVFGGFIAACLLVGSYVFTAAHTINLANLALAGVAFLCIPKNKMLWICGYLDATKNRERYSKRSMHRLRMRTADEIDNTMKVCREIASLFASKSGLAEEPADAKEQWIIQAAANVCIDCPMQKYCWQDLKLAAESVMAMLYAHERGERIRIRKPFDPSCKHMIQIAAAAWQAQNQYLVQHAMQQQTARQYAFVNRQLLGICGVIDRLTHQVREDRWLDETLEHRLYQGLDRHGIRVYGIEASFPQGRLLLHIRVQDSYREHPLPILEAVHKTLHRQVRMLSSKQEGKQCVILLEEAQLLSVSVGIAASAMSRSGINGDCTGVRPLPQGKMLCVLSDGMGAGASARKESESAIHLLFDMYACGFTRETALESVNRLLLEKGKDMYATLDVVYVDLATGQAEFIKYGAPPTFVFRGKKLHTVCAEALPAGIVDEATPAIHTAKLRRDDFVFLFSDGALEALKDTTQTAIYEALSEATDSQMISELLLQRAKSNGQEDDMTIMVIRVA